MSTPTVTSAQIQTCSSIIDVVGSISNYGLGLFSCFLSILQSFLSSLDTIDNGIHHFLELFLIHLAVVISEDSVTLINQSSQSVLFCFGLILISLQCSQSSIHSSLQILLDTLIGYRCRLILVGLWIRL